MFIGGVSWMKNGWPWHHLLNTKVLKKQIRPKTGSSPSVNCSVIILEILYKDLDAGTTLNSLGNFVSPSNPLPGSHRETNLPSGQLDVKTQS